MTAKTSARSVPGTITALADGAVKIGCQVEQLQPAKRRLRRPNPAAQDVLNVIGQEPGLVRARRQMLPEARS